MDGMNLPANLHEIMHYIGERYTFTAEHYPALKNATPEERRAFAVNHSVYHMAKSVGKLASECEAADHGGEMDEAALRRATVKMLINALKLAEEIGMDADDLAREVPQCMK